MQSRRVLSSVPYGFAQSVLSALGAGENWFMLFEDSGGRHSTQHPTNALLSRAIASLIQYSNTHLSYPT